MPRVCLTACTFLGKYNYVRVIILARYSEVYIKIKMLLFSTFLFIKEEGSRRGSQRWEGLAFPRPRPWSCLGVRHYTAGKIAAPENIIRKMFLMARLERNFVSQKWDLLHDLS